MADSIILGADHAGYELKEAIKQYLEQKNIQYKDVGCYSKDRCDYPDVAAQVARAVQNKEYAYGVLCCGSGIGMAMAANRFPGVRAVVSTEPFSAEMSRRHNNANVICFGERVIAQAMAQELLEKFIKTPFEEGRHQERTQKMDEIVKGEQLQC